MQATISRPENLRNDSSQELWSAFKEGSKEAFSELFSKNYPRLFRYGMSLVHEHHLVKDSIQEVFLSLWRNRINLADASSVEYYMIISLKRELIKARDRTNKRYSRNLEYIEGFKQIEAGLEQFIIRKETEEERYRLYQKAFKTLTSRQREALRLRMEFGLDNREIAAVMNLSDKRIRNIIYEATKTLREWVITYQKAKAKVHENS